MTKSRFEEYMDSIKEENLINHKETYLITASMRDSIKEFGLNPDSPELWQGAIAASSIIANTCVALFGVVSPELLSLLGYVGLAATQNYDDVVKANGEG